MAGNWVVDWGLFIGVMALGQMSPGPDLLLITRISLREGLRAGLLVVLGVVVGLCMHAALAVVGMSAFLASGGLWVQVLSILATGYLGWLGWQMFSSFLRAGAYDLVTPEQDGEAEQFFLKGLFCNLLNPKVLIFFAGLTALFLQEERGLWWPALLWITIVVEGLLLWGLWVFLLQRKRLRAFYAQQSRWLDLFFGVGLWVLAILFLGNVFRGG